MDPVSRSILPGTRNPGLRDGFCFQGLRLVGRFVSWVILCLRRVASHTCGVRRFRRRAADGSLRLGFARDFRVGAGRGSRYGASLMAGGIHSSPKPRCALSVNSNQSVRSRRRPTRLTGSTVDASIDRSGASAGGRYRVTRWKLEWHTRMR
jgi:hypothetical protein